MELKSLALSALICANFQGCFFNSNHSSSLTNSESSLHLQMLGLNVPELNIPIDSAILQISALGINDIRISQALSQDSTMSAEHIPAGKARTLQLSLYDPKGSLLFHGDTLIDLLGGQKTHINMMLEQQFGMLKAKVPLPLSGNTADQGLLWLIKGNDTLKTTLGGSLGNREFTLAPIAYADAYQMLVRLWNNQGDTLYSYSGLIDIKANSNQNLSLQLQSLYASLDLSISVQTQTTQNLLFEIPGSSHRSPINYGDLVISEIMPNPGVSADSSEYLEFYNASGDTLLLGGCALRKTRSSSTPTTSLILDSLNLKIAPSQTIVLGREKVAFATANYHSLTFSNTAQDLLLLCNNNLIDSLSYSDTKNPYAVGIAMQLDLDHFTLRNESTSWCSGSVAFSSGSLNLKGSPNSTPSCD